MSSAYAVYPSSLLDSNRRDRLHEPRSAAPSYENHQPTQPTAAVATNHLSPFPSSQARSTSASPTLNSHTPAESVSTLSVHYQSSEFSDLGNDDPFFGVDFNFEGGSPAFLDDQILPEDLSRSQGFSQTSLHTPDAADQDAYHPLSPDKTPSLHTTSPNIDRRARQAVFSEIQQDAISPQQLTRVPDYTNKAGHQLTPDTSGSGHSSEDGLAPANSAMPGQSPRVTVSLWGKDPVNPSAAPQEAQQDIAISGALYSDADTPAAGIIRDETGRWATDPATGHQGVAPDGRSSAEGPSPNELAAQRKRDARNREVDDWLTKSGTLPNQPHGQTEQPQPRLQLQTSDTFDDGIPDREIALGHQTENNVVDGQIYYRGTNGGGEIAPEDLELMQQSRNWADAPVLFPISQPDSGRFQPDTAQAAIERFERLCRDNASIVSRAATWGTRRRSLPSIADIEEITSGNFLKKLSLSKGDARRPSIFKELRGLVKKPSTSFKRNRNDPEDDLSGIDESPGERRDSLAPPTRTMSWGKKQPMPSINTALVAMGGNMASIGATHARSGSISNTPITSPKSTTSAFALKVNMPLTRMRSKSDLSKAPGGIADMWKRTGGPPVAVLAKSNGVDGDDDDEDDEELYEEPDMRAEANRMIESITPNFAGFQQHVLKLNPMLATTNNFLVDRIAHQQIVRYKSLLNSRVKHLQYIAGKNCSCGSLCIALGGSANVLDSKGDPRGLDPLSARYDGSDGDITPLEGAISQESFPQDIPLPPTSSLPAEFECQLCFQPKKFQKPSDWTKHVHEDVQPFTCTWDRCRDPKIFKRKADWVRHENEGHRHLEWWICDVEDCRHICYRRDNFLQHLVREHKFPEPRVKTKAAIKRAGGSDPTWQKVESCHEETQVRPQDEPCRFCGKSFPTWKKLTVHLAKHMEQISLPILRLVARKELDADTIISPVQEPPPRNFPAPVTSVKRESQPYDTSPGASHPPVARAIGPMQYANTQEQFMFQPMVAPTQFSQPMFSGQFESLSQSLHTPHLGVQPVNQFASMNTNLNPQGYQSMPVTTGTYMGAPNQYISVAPDLEPFPAMTMNALGLQDPNAGQVAYAGMMDPISAGTEHFTPQGSVSPFSHSPHQGQGGFYHPQ